MDRASSERRGWVRLVGNRWRRILGIVRANRTLAVAAATLLSIDLAFTLWWGVTRLLYNLEINKSLYELRLLRIDAEGGLPEWFNYVQTLVLVLLVGRLCQMKRQWIYAALALLFALVLADDMLEIHEIGGKYFARTLGLRPMHGLRAVDFGELITWGLLGILIAPWILVGLRRATHSDLVNGLALLLPFGALVFCGMFVDQMYHVLRHAFFGADILLGMLEDGGEMVALTVACVGAGALVKETEIIRDPESPRLLR